MSHTLNYVIRGFDEKVGQILVEVTCVEHNNVQTFAVDLPIKEDNTYPVGEELNDLMKSMTPTWFFERMDKTSAGVANVDAIKALVIPYPEPEPLVVGTPSEVPTSGV
jgi:hypothetical protein